MQAPGTRTVVVLMGFCCDGIILGIFREFPTYVIEPDVPFSLFLHLDENADDVICLCFVSSFVVIVARWLQASNIALTDFAIARIAVFKKAVKFDPKAGLHILVKN